MAIVRKSSIKNYDILSGFSWHVPGVSGMFGLLLWLLAGGLLGNVLSLLLMFAVPGFSTSSLMAVAYVLMFIPAMLASRYISNQNLMSGKAGYALDNNNFSPYSGGLIALLCMIATIACQMVADPVTTLLPPMPEQLKKILESAVSGDSKIISFITTCVFAPFFEEWLCRGMVLRGLLHYRRRPGSEPMKPIWAIVISAAFFALIHLNPWQAIPAFLLGMLFGYVYYRTGSLKLTMLMHFTNNAFATLLSSIDSTKEVESILDLMPAWAVCCCVVVAIPIIVCFVKLLSKTEMSAPEGNFEELKIDDSI
ncbi:hypothetical protein SAMN06298215_1108 [Bacteroidales bacterium WCE2008]|nr:hypothetical protein SAMN06298215_1108 [Bacteroidales bacterium WCE2008]